MVMADVRPDERVISSLRRIIETVRPQFARIGYDGAPAHPLTESQTFEVGLAQGSQWTLEELYAFLGERGYIDTIKWYRYPKDERYYVQVSIHHGGKALSVVNCFRSDSTHFVGLRAAGRMPTDQAPFGVSKHIVDNDEQLVEQVLSLIVV